jgi:MYXO-CTERM domain-containing protein
VNTVESATGRKPIVYTFGSYFSSNGIDTTGLADLPLFIADITTSACINVPSPWALATFWQYSWTGTVAGVTGQVDRDRFVGSLASLKAYLSMPPSSQDEVEAGPEASSQSGDGSAGSDAAASPGVDEAAASDLVGAEEAGQAGQDGSPRSAGKATAAAAAGCACSMARSSRSTGGLLFGLLLIGGLAARRVRSRCTPEERIRS